MSSSGKKSWNVSENWRGKKSLSDRSRRKRDANERNDTNSANVNVNGNAIDNEKKRKKKERIETEIDVERRRLLVLVGRHETEIATANVIETEIVITFHPLLSKDQTIEEGKVLYFK